MPMPSDTRNVLWLLLIACCWTHLGISGIHSGVFRADVVNYNIGLWTESARNHITKSPETSQDMNDGE